MEVLYEIHSMQELSEIDVGQTATRLRDGVVLKDKTFDLKKNNFGRGRAMMRKTEE